MSARSTRPNAPDHDQVVEVVTLAAYERLRVDLAIAHGTELVSWDEQNPKMRVDLRETVEPTVSDTFEALDELGYAVVPREWLGGPPSDNSVVVTQVDAPAEPGALRGLVVGAGSAVETIVKLPQSAFRPIKRVVAKVLGPAA